VFSAELKRGVKVNAPELDRREHHQLESRISLWDGGERDQQEPLSTLLSKASVPLVELPLQSDQTYFEVVLANDLIASLSDYDQDGYVDGTDIPENELELRYYDSAVGARVPILACTVIEEGRNTRLQRWLRDGGLSGSTIGSQSTAVV